MRSKPQLETKKKPVNYLTKLVQDIESHKNRLLPVAIDNIYLSEAIQEVLSMDLRRLKKKAEQMNDEELASLINDAIGSFLKLRPILARIIVPPKAVEDLEQALGPAKEAVKKVRSAIYYRRFQRK
jgi:hypothetical protein